MPFVPEELQCRIASNAETQEQIEQLRNLASRDALTGLFNRRHFFEHAPALIAEARARWQKSAVAILDIDDFKQLNDSHGHDLGDRALAGVARCLSQSIEGSNSLLARIGGEEFAILFPGLDAKAAMRRADHVRLDVSHETVTLGEHQVALTASIGVAEIDENVSFDQALVAADRALYAAKREGRNRVCVQAA
jgi:diguanylate cyclase (GGDEF)-like protein